MIKAISLTKVFRTESVETTALNGINLEINEGEFLAIMDIEQIDQACRYVDILYVYRYG